MTGAVIALILAVIQLGCSRDMQEQPSFSFQEAPRKHSPTGSVSQSGREVLLSAPARTPERLRRGADLFRINCTPCHGPRGEGNGPVAGHLVGEPADLTADSVQEALDEEIYEVVTNGEDVMPSFRGLLSAEERWAIVYYVKSFG
jgi:mono/diheme cytochrome c family protein